MGSSPEVFTKKQEIQTNLQEIYVEPGRPGLLDFPGFDKGICADNLLEM